MIQKHQTLTVNIWPNLFKIIILLKYLTKRQSKNNNKFGISKLIDKNIAILVIKAKLRAKEDKIVKVQGFDSSISVVKVILKMVELKIIQCIYLFKGIYKRFFFQHGYRKGSLMKVMISVTNYYSVTFDESKEKFTIPFCCF